MKLLSYPRSVVMGLLYPFVLLSYSALAILMNLIFNSRPMDDAIIRSWGQVSCKMFGVEVIVQGLENIPASGCLFLFNHTSFFDIFAMAAVIPGIRFGAKIELFKIPLFGFAMRRMGILPIDRGNREKVFDVYREAQDRLRRGERFALAPEGTRQNEEKLGPFKAGPFIFAINTGAPVIPVVIKNASQILPKHTIFPNWGVWKRPVDLRLLRPVAADGLSTKDRLVLQEKVRAEMLPFF